MKRLTRYAGLIAGASLLTAGLGGCTGSDGGDWNNAPKMHTCTADQMAKVQAETRWCADNTTYLSTYCYGTAMIRNCQRIKTPNVEVQRRAGIIGTSGLIDWFGGVLPAPTFERIEDGHEEDAGVQFIATRPRR